MVAIFAVLLVLTLIAMDVYIQAREAETVPAVQPVSISARPLSPELPRGLFVHPGHTWAEILRAGQVQVGLDDLVARVLDRPHRVILRQPGEELVQGEPMMILEHGSRQLKLAAPVSGVIERINHELMQGEQCFEGRSYEKWAYVLKPRKLAQEVGLLRVAETAHSWIREEGQRFANWVETRLMLQPEAALQDGGTLVPGALVHLDEEAWLDFQQKFLGDGGELG